MEEDVVERLVDVVRFSKIPLGRLFAEFVEQVGYDRLMYAHDREFIKLLESFYSE